MRFEIEFFQRTKASPDGRTIRRNSGQFASERDAETYAFLNRPPTADGFRILRDGSVVRTMAITSATPEP